MTEFSVAPLYSLGPRRDLKFAAAVRDLRESLIAAGRSLAKPPELNPDFPTGPGLSYAPPRLTTEVEDAVADACEADEWNRVSKLGWVLRGDRLLTRRDVAARFAAMPSRDRRAVAAWLRAKADALADVPTLARKSMETRLQIAALGAVWVAAVRDNPDLACFAVGQAQPIGLEKLLLGA